MDDVQAHLLRELETYTAFLKRRQELEQDYADQLRKLSLRAQQQAAGLDDDPSSRVPLSWRKAWVAVRAAVEDEGRAHRQSAEGLDRIVSGLSTLRDNRDRIRRRIKDDLRSTATEYSDYKAVVSRLRKTYERKVEELQHHEEAEALKEEVPPGGGGGAGGKSGNGDGSSWPPEHWTGGGGEEYKHTLPTPAYLRKRSDSAASSRGGGTSAGASDADSPPHSVISPSSTPVFVSGATSSSSDPKTGPYRDPPTGKQNVFEAIAKRDWSGEKHRVNSIVRAVGSLAKGTDPAAALGPSRGLRSRQYGGKLKREAEQADRDYRDGVFRLETLRLQKVRVQSSARESLREFVLELATTLKSVFEQRVGDEISTGHSLVAIGEHVKPEVEKVNAPHDTEQFYAATVNEQAATDPPVYYINAFVGECKSLLFGVGLQDYYAKHPTALVPLIVQRCIAYLDQHGLEYEGIYRVPGKLATIQQIVTRMEKDEETFQFGPTDDPPAVASVLKLYLRQLPTPLFPFPTADRKSFTTDYSSSPETTTATLMRRIRRLSPPQQATLKALCEHLARVAEREQTNKMGVSNLGLILSPVVFVEDDAASLESALHTTKDVVMEVLIRQHVQLFDGLPIEPPVPSRRPSGAIATLVQQQPGPPSSSSAGPSVPSSQSDLGMTAPSSPPTTLSSVANSPQPQQLPQMLPTSSAMRPAGSIDSVYSLYQRATAPGFFPSSSPDSSPDAPNTGFLPHPPQAHHRAHPSLSTSATQRGAYPAQRVTASPLAGPPAQPSYSAPALTPMSERSLELRESDYVVQLQAEEARQENGREQGNGREREKEEHPHVQAPPRESSMPPASPPPAHPQSPPLRHDLDTPSPPLTAAMGRRVPTPEQ
ncbi:hypothetical protein JCM8097_006735 [Rhodosporidiobolus ruineniae]